MVSGNSLSNSFHRIHETKGCAEDQIEALAGQAAEDLFRVGAFGHVLNVGSVYIRNILLNILKAFIVSL